MSLLEQIDMEVYRERGREFGYEECCINFFCDRWVFSPTVQGMERLLLHVGGSVAQKKSVFVSAVYASLAKWAGFKPGHIPCPECLAKELIKKFPVAAAPKQPAPNQALLEVRGLSGSCRACGTSVAGRVCVVEPDRAGLIHIGCYQGTAETDR